MYSIYDYYGTVNDLQNRYDAAKNAGSGQTTQVARSLPTGNNAPFLPVTSTNQQTTQYVPQSTGLSIYDAPGEGGSFSATGSAYTSADLANYPSPSWMEPVANAMFNAFSGIADKAVPGLGFAMQQGRAYSMDPTNYSLGRNLTSGALNYGLNYGVNRSGLMGEIMQGLSTGKQALDAGIGLAAKGGISSLINNFVNFITGNLFGPVPSRGHNNMAGFDDETYGYSSTALTPAQIAAQYGISLGSLLASSPFGGASYANEYAPGGLYNPYADGSIATGPSEAGEYGGASGFSSPSGQTGEVDQGYFDDGGYDTGGNTGWGGDTGYSGDAWGDPW